LLEIGFGNFDLWAVESFGKVMAILTDQGVRTLVMMKNARPLVAA
jgi:hypothetical protein